jgi:hypothetical protein
MRKKIISNKKGAPESQVWLNLENIAEVEMSSELPSQPIEGALLQNDVSGWRAAEPGKQTIRLVFDQPQQLQRIYLEFEELSSVRTQEYVLSWSANHGETFREIARQQWNFSPEGSVHETEDHHVNLSAVTELELSIIPDISGGGSLASLTSLRIA